MLAFFGQMTNDGCDYEERIGPAGAGRTLLDYLAARWTHSTPEAWRERILAARVHLDGRAGQLDTVLRAGMRLVWSRPGWQEPDAAEDFGVLFEDDAVLVVDKPAGLPTLPGAGFFERTLLRQVRRMFPTAAPLHRLGRWTSGAVLFARTAEAAADLSKQWVEGRIGKRYRALLSGDPAWEDREITVPIGPVPHPLLGSVCAADPSTGKPASSRARVLQRRGGTTLCDVVIATGRPHQIRIHCAAAGHPLAGDPLYAPGGGLREGTTALPGDPGYSLHAAEIAFRPPRREQTIIVSSPPPPALRVGGAGAGRDNGDSA